MLKVAIGIPAGLLPNYTGDCAVHSIDSIFADPVTLEPLRSVDGYLASGTKRYLFENNVIDFNSPVTEGLEGTEGTPSRNDLRIAQDAAFESARNSDGEIYGSLFDLPAITQAGHWRRMELLAEIELPELEDAVVVDFGTGPWGFAAIYPRLRRGGLCIGFDISIEACRQARDVSVSAADGSAPDRTIYAATDGDTLPLQDSSVDVFFGGEVIEHVKNPVAFMHEIDRVCRDGATVILTTPNVDGINYLLARLPFATGPEHIALMSTPVFRDLLDRYTDDVQIKGYEVSIGPGMDDFPLADETLNAIQRRTADTPELATGLVSVSRVSKAKLAVQPKPRLVTDNSFRAEGVEVNGRSEALTLFGNVEGLMLADSDGRIVLQRSGELAVLLFWGHAWSGFVDIACGGLNWSRDLYLPEGGFVRVELGIPKTERAPIVVQRGNHKRPIAEDEQVIFHRLFDYTFE